MMDFNYMICYKSHTSRSICYYSNFAHPQHLNEFSWKHYKLALTWINTIKSDFQAAYMIFILNIFDNHIKDCMGYH